MNRNILKNILILLLSATAVLSCSEDLTEDLYNPSYKEGYAVVISGTASDMDTSLPIEEIRITLKATEELGNDRMKSYEKSSYTDNNGVFTMEVEGFTNPISVKLTAEDPNGIYQSATHEIPMISWESSYNMEGNRFYVNECSFYLEKKK